MNAPMAAVVLGGLTFGTLLTLFVIPAAIYYTIEKKSKHIYQFNSKLIQLAKEKDTSGPFWKISHDRTPFLAIHKL